MAGGRAGPAGGARRKPSSRRSSALRSLLSNTCTGVPFFMRMEAPMLSRRWSLPVLQLWNTGWRASACKRARSARLAATLAAAWSPKLISGWPLRLSRMLRCRPLWATSWSCRACACTAGSLRRSRSSSRLWRICSSFNCRFSRSRASSSRPRFQCAIAPSARASSAPRAPTSRARRSDSRPGGVIGALPGRSRRREWYGSA